MLHNILLTGASGYLGGSVLAKWAPANLPEYGKLYALTRDEKAAESVRRYGAEPVEADISNAEAVKELVSTHRITIVLFLIDAVNSEGQLAFIDALSAVRKETGQDVHLIHTSGAKMFSNHAGAPIDRKLWDTESDLYDIQKAQTTPLANMQKAVNTNNKVIEAGKIYDVSTYILVPPIVYGKGSGFGNPISIQTTAVIKAALAMGRVLSVDSGPTEWPVCHIDDISSLYLQLVRRILEDKPLPHGKNGYYLAASGSIAWKDLYGAIAKALAQKGRVDDADIREASSKDLAAMGKALGCPREFVPVSIGGTCTFSAAHGNEVGWKAKYGPQHILESANDETDRVLARLDGGQHSHGSQFSSRGS